MINVLPKPGLLQSTFTKLLRCLSVVCVCGFFAGTAQAQLNESLNSTPFQVQGNDASPAQSGDQFSPARLVEFERILNAVLKTRRVQERQFIKSLVEQIGTGGLSPELVQTSFKWVRRKRPDTPFPFLYFERVVRIIGTQQGVGDLIPPFDDSIIGQPNQPNEDGNGVDTNGTAGIVTQ